MTHRARWPARSSAATATVFLNKISLAPGRPYLTDSLRQRDNPGSGLIRQSVRHSGHSVQISLVTTFTCSVPLSGALFRSMCPYPGLFRITASFSPCPVVHIPLDKNALSEKMSKNFFGDRNFVVGRTSASGHNCWHVQKTGAEIKN